MPSLVAALPKFSIVAMFIDLLVYSKCQIKSKFWSILDLSYKHQLNESGIYTIPGVTYK